MAQPRKRHLTKADLQRAYEAGFRDAIYGAQDHIDMVTAAMGNGYDLRSAKAIEYINAYLKDQDAGTYEGEE